MTAVTPSPPALLHATSTSAAPSAATTEARVSTARVSACLAGPVLIALKVDVLKPLF